jgi:(p)ppGpp synthase/HD superfamily hydrolase
MRDIIKAIQIAIHSHGGQLDKQGHPYVLHPLWVMSRMTTEDEMIAAVLHDAVEDTSTTIQDLRNEGFSDASIKAIELLTHDKNIPYPEYIQKLAPNKIARKVKLADLEHNLDVRRLKEITPEDVSRIEKYKQAFSLLKSYE